jgi:hypothetical protein
MGKHASKSVVFWCTAFESINNSLISIRRGHSENTIADTGQNNFAETVWGCDESAKDGESAKREPNSVNNWIFRQVI